MSSAPNNYRKFSHGLCEFLLLLLDTSVTRLELMKFSAPTTEAFKSDSLTAARARCKGLHATSLFSIEQSSNFHFIKDPISLLHISEKREMFEKKTRKKKNSLKFLPTQCAAARFRHLTNTRKKECTVEREMKKQILENHLFISSFSNLLK